MASITGTGILAQRRNSVKGTVPECRIVRRGARWYHARIGHGNQGTWGLA
jgi:hypothetical protein